MAEVIKMPKMSDTMEEGVIASWQKKVGDEVKSGDILAEVETDKATMELESYENGVLLYVGVKEQEAVPVDGVIAIIGEKGENIDDLIKSVKAGDSSKAEEKKGKDSGSGENGREESKKAKPDEGEEGADAEEIDTSDINATVVTMPRMSDTMEEGVISSWQKKVGDQVKSGDVLAEVETDKATMELEAYEDGVLLYVGVEEGNSVPVDGVIAVIGEKGADYKKLLKAQESKQKPSKSSEPSAEPEKSTEKPAAKTEEKIPSKTEVKTDGSTSTFDGRLKASPLAKRLAEEKGYDIAQIPGTGEQGRIIKRDVEEYRPVQEKEEPAKTASAEPTIHIPTFVGEERSTDVPVSQMRKAIARRVSESKFSAPHFYVTMEINMDKAVEARKSLNELSPVKISYNDIVIKAVAAALRQHPKVNASWLGDKIRMNEHIHIGVAVAVEEGLLIPVVRFADNKSLSQLSVEIKGLGQKVRDKKLQPSDWEGSTFTVSNLGMFGVEEFTAIINPPDACILAVGGIQEKPIVKDGQVVPGHTMKVTLSCDHRAVDGAIGSAFLQTLKGLLEDPVRILI